MGRGGREGAAPGLLTGLALGEGGMARPRRGVRAPPGLGPPKAGRRRGAGEARDGTEPAWEGAKPEEEETSGAVVLACMVCVKGSVLHVRMRGNKYQSRHSPTRATWLKGKASEEG